MIRNDDSMMDAVIPSGAAKRWSRGTPAFVLFAATLSALAMLSTIAIPASAQQPIATMLLWPNGNPEPSKISAPETDPTTNRDRMVFGKITVRVTNISKPGLAVYAPPAAKNTGAAALVLPGGSYIRLAYNIEGTEICDWLNSIGMTCVLVKYRVPENGHHPDNTEDLEDAQQAMRLTRAHAAEWHIDPKRIGAIGFSAGAHLAAVLSTHPDFQKANAAAASGFSAQPPDARPNFQMILYPGWLTGKDNRVAPSLVPDASVPPTFLVQAENDYTAHVENSLGYFLALKDAHVPAEMHLFTLGGHGFGLRPKELPIGSWPSLARAVAALHPHPRSAGSGREAVVIGGCSPAGRGSRQAGARVRGRASRQRCRDRPCRSAGCAGPASRR
jgi:acetyl esterase/lipase